MAIAALNEPSLIRYNTARQSPSRFVRLHYLSVTEQEILYVFIYI